MPNIGCNCGGGPEETDEALEICIAEGNAIDHNTTCDKHDMTRTVWENFKPPSQLTGFKPTVTARQLDITRAVLNSTAGSSETSTGKPKKIRISEENNSTCHFDL